MDSWHLNYTNLTVLPAGVLYSVVYHTVTVIDVISPPHYIQHTGTATVQHLVLTCGVQFVMCGTSCCCPSVRQAPVAVVV